MTIRKYWPLCGQGPHGSKTVVFINLYFPPTFGETFTWPALEKYCNLVKPIIRITFLQ